MIQKLSSLNIIFAIVYVLLFLKNGTFNSTAGIFMIVVFNWLGLRAFQIDNYRWKVWDYLTGIWSLYFIGTLVYGEINILSASIEYNFISNDILMYLVINFLFCVSVSIHLILYAYKNYKQLKHSSINY